MEFVDKPCAFWANSSTCTSQPWQICIFGICGVVGASEVGEASHRSPRHHELSSGSRCLLSQFRLSFNVSKTWKNDGKRLLKGPFQLAWLLLDLEQLQELEASLQG